MTTHVWMNRASAGAIAAALAALTLAACQKGPAAGTAPAPTDANAPQAVATLPLTDAPAQPAAAAPSVSALPARSIPRVRVARAIDRYAFSDRANRVGYGLGDAPPDYSFDYQGVRPWAWRSQAGYQVVVEPLPGGGDRYYYYQPGSDQPYLVRDPDYAYGYQGGALAVVYDRDGRPLPDSDIDRASDPAGRYFYRALALFAAATSAQHLAVGRDDWSARRPRIDAAQSRWQASQARDPQWRAYRDQYAQQNGPSDQAMWQAERDRRAAYPNGRDQAQGPAQPVYPGRPQTQTGAPLGPPPLPLLNESQRAAPQAAGQADQARRQGLAAQQAREQEQARLQAQAQTQARDTAARQMQAAQQQEQARLQALTLAQAQARMQAQARDNASRQTLAAQQAETVRLQVVAKTQHDAQVRRQAAAQGQAQVRAQADARALAERQALARQEAIRQNATRPPLTPVRPAVPPAPAAPERPPVPRPVPPQPILPLAQPLRVKPVALPDAATRARIAASKAALVTRPGAQKPEPNKKESEPNVPSRGNDRPQ